jgi:AcrR family transcriptional regulator
MQVLKKEIYKAIQDNALQLFKHFSYEGVNIEEIAYKAKVSTGNVYRYYDGKRDVYNKVIFAAYEKLDEKADKILEKDNIEAKEIIEKIIDVYKEEKDATIIILGAKNTINEELLEKYEKIFIKTFAEDESDILDKTYAMSIFYSFRVLIDKNYKAIELNDKLNEYVKKYVEK